MSARRAATWWFLAYAAAAPAVLVDRSLGWRLHALYVVMLVGVAGLVALRRGGRVALAVPELSTLAMLTSLGAAAWLGATTVLSPRATLWGAWLGVAHAAVFLVSRRALQPGDTERDRRALGAVLVTAAITLVVGFMGESTFVDARPTGHVGNPNLLGAAAGAIAVAAAHVLRGRILRTVVVVVMAALLVATQSRGALAATWVVALATTPGARARVVFVTLSVVAALALVAVPNPLRERWAAEAATFSRPELWGFALSAAADHPFGVGPGAYRDVVASIAWDPARPWLVHQRHAIGLTHSAPLTILVEWGWLAGAALCVLVVWTLRRLVAHGRRDAAQLGLTVVAAVLFLESCVAGLEQVPLVATWLLVAVAGATARTPDERARLHVPARAAGTALLVVSLGFAVASVTHQREHLRFEAARAALADARSGARPHVDVGEELRTLALAHPEDERLWLELGRLWTTAARGAEARDRPLLVERARRALDQAAARAALANAPRGVTSERWRLERWAHTAGVEASPQPLRTALDAHLIRDPLDVEALWARLRLELGVDRDDLAEPVARRLFEVEPNHVEARWALARRAEAAGRLDVALGRYVRCAEAILNARRLVSSPSSSARAFYARQASAADLDEVLEAAARLRRVLYF